MEEEKRHYPALPKYWRWLWAFPTTHRLGSPSCGLTLRGLLGKHPQSAILQGSGSFSITVSSPYPAGVHVTVYPLTPLCATLQWSIASWVATDTGEPWAHFIVTPMQPSLQKKMAISLCTVSSIQSAKIGWWGLQKPLSVRILTEMHVSKTVLQSDLTAD